MKQEDFFIKGSRSSIDTDHEFDFFNHEEGISHSTCPQAFLPIIGLFAQDSNYSLEKVFTFYNSLQIVGYDGDKKSKLEMQYKVHPDNDIVVSRVKFVNRRQGNMTKLYKMLQNIQREYGAGDIVLESVISDGMISWCEKNGFVRSPKNFANFVTIEAAERMELEMAK